MAGVQSTVLACAMLSSAETGQNENNKERQREAVRKVCVEELERPSALRSCWLLLYGFPAPTECRPHSPGLHRHKLLCGSDTRAGRAFGRMKGNLLGSQGTT